MQSDVVKRSEPVAESVDSSVVESVLKWPPAQGLLRFPLHRASVTPLDTVNAVSPCLAQCAQMYALRCSRTGQVPLFKTACDKHLSM